MDSIESKIQLRKSFLELKHEQEKDKRQSFLSKLLENLEIAKNEQNLQKELLLKVEIEKAKEIQRKALMARSSAKNYFDKVFLAQLQTAKDQGKSTISKTNTSFVEQQEFLEECKQRCVHCVVKKQYVKAVNDGMYGTSTGFTIFNNIIDVAKSEKNYLKPNLTLC